MKKTTFLTLILSLCIATVINAQNDPPPPMNHPRVCIGSSPDGFDGAYVPDCNDANEDIRIFYGYAIPNSTTLTFSYQGQSFSEIFPGPEMNLDPDLFLDLHEVYNLCNDNFNEVVLTLHVCVSNPGAVFDGVHGGEELSNDCYEVDVMFCCDPGGGNSDGSSLAQHIDKASFTFDQNDAIHTSSTIVDDVTREKKRFCFPNPTRDYVTLNTAFDKLEIFDNTGLKVKEVNYSQQENFQLNMQDYKLGIYYIVIQSGTEVSIEKIIRY